MKITIAMFAALAFSTATARADTAENKERKTRTVRWKTDASSPEIEEIKEVFFDAEGNETHYFMLRNGGFSRWNLLIWHPLQSGQPQHAVPFKGEGLDVSEDLDILSLLPVSSGYRTENVALSAALSDDGKSVVITLTNISDAPVTVHKEAFTRPRIDLNRPPGLRVSPFVSKEFFQETPLAASEALRHEIPLREIFEEHAGVIKKLVFKNDPDAELYIRTDFFDLFPTTHDTRPSQTSLPRTTLGTFGEIKAKNPELFPSADTADFSVKNISLSAALSDDGQSVVVTLTNVSDAPVKVNKGAFMQPHFSVSWSSETSFGGYGWGGSTTFEETQLAPGESLRHEATVKEILKNNSSTIKKVLSKNDPEVKLSISTAFTDLLPFSLDAKSDRSRPDYVPLGTLAELNAKYPELFSLTDASE